MFSKRFYLFFIILFLCYQHAAYANEFYSPIITDTNEQVAIENERNAFFANRLQLLAQHSQQKPAQIITPSQLHQLDITITLIKEDFTGIEITLAAVKQANDLTQNYILVLQSQLQNTQLVSRIREDMLGNLHAQLKTQLMEQRALREIQLKRIKILQTALDQLAKTLNVAQKWKTQLEINYQIQQTLQRQTKLKDLAENLQQTQQIWLARLANLNQQLSEIKTTDFLNNPGYIQLQVNILQAEEQGNIAQYQIDLMHIDNNIDNLMFIAKHVYSISDLDTVEQRIIILSQSLEANKALINQKILLLQNRCQVFKSQLQTGVLPISTEKLVITILKELTNKYETELQTANKLSRQAFFTQNFIKEKLAKQLTVRQPWPSFDQLVWEQLGEQLKQISSLMKQRLNTVYKITVNSLQETSLWQRDLAVLVLIIWIYIWYKLKQNYLDLAIASLSKPKQSISNIILLTAVRLIKHHTVGLILLGGLCSILYILNISLANFSLLINIVAVIIVFKMSISLSYLTLIKNNIYITKSSMRFYHYLRGIFIFGGIITILNIVIQTLPLAYYVQDLFGRLFMFFLMLFATVLFKIWTKLSSLLAFYMQNKKDYLKQVVCWLTCLIPLSVFLNALIGVFGYVTLAWSLVYYQSIFLLILTGFLLLSGLLGEIKQSATKQLILHGYNGLLWHEVVFKPLYWLSKIFLLWYAIIIFFNLSGWDQQSWVMVHIKQILYFKLFTLGTSTVETINVLQLLAIIMIFIWVTKWTREFAHKWLFADIKDRGLRNSLAVFSQYAMLVFGVAIALHISGIDLTALTVVMSVFAAGIGFGLRDLANNFISGILLLIERPMRIGDYVTLAGHEGEVKHIGMRSITVITNINQELVVPNSQVYNKAFINWTRYNSAARTLINLKITRLDDPHQVKNIILDVLKLLPSLLKEPAPLVEFKELNEALLELNVSYYIDINDIATIHHVRSAVLYALWDRFKAEGINSPEIVHAIKIQGDLNKT